MCPLKVETPEEKALFEEGISKDSFDKSLITLLCYNFKIVL